MFTAGAVGPPGQRVFYLQARDRTELVAWKCEKQQVAALGEYLQRMLADLPQPDAVPDEAPSSSSSRSSAQWPVGSLGVAYDEDDDRIVVVADELVETDEEGDPAPGVEPGDGARPHHARAGARLRRDRASG